MKRWIALAIVGVVGLAGAGCSRQSSKAAGRLNVNGQALITMTDGGQRTVTGSRTLRSGEQVLVTDGTATLGLGQERQLELRKDSDVRLVVATAPSGARETRAELIGGDILVTSPGGTATVAAGDTAAEISGAARVSRRLAVVVAAYEGSSKVESVAKAVVVPALRQVTVPAPGLPSRPTPLAFSADDTWDQRYLGDWVDLGNQLVARGRGFTAQLPAGQDTGESFFRQILPALRDQPFDASLLDDSRTAGETLVGAAITLEGTRGEFRERWSRVFGFRAEGASWGLVALDQAVGRQPVLNAVDAAIGRLSSLAPVATRPAPPGGTPTPAPVAAPSTGGSAPPGSQAAAPPPPSGATAGNGPAGTASASNGSAPPSSPAPPATGGTLNTGLPVVDDTVNAVIDLLTGVLRSVGGQP